MSKVKEPKYYNKDGTPTSEAFSVAITPSAAYELARLQLQLHKAWVNINEIRKLLPSEYIGKPLRWRIKHFLENRRKSNGTF